jgi:GDPmannose 4,6-dehydratase
MWLMLRHDEPGDYIVATGVSRSVEELVACAFDAVSLDWRDHVRSDPSLFRGTAELHDLVGDASRARRILGWEPEVSFEELLRLMVEADLARLQAETAAS